MEILKLILVLATIVNVAGGEIIDTKDNPEQTSVINPKVQILRGKLIYEEIPPVMSVKAYRGEEFFLAIASPNSQRLVLRPSSQVSREQLQSFHNQQVEIEAIYVEGTRPESSKTACPIDANGQCMQQGDGYQVLSVVRSISNEPPRRQERQERGKKY